MPQRVFSAIIGVVVGVTTITPLIDRAAPYKRTTGKITPADGYHEIERGGLVAVNYDTVVWRRCPGDAVRHVIDGNGLDHEYAPHAAAIYDQPQDNLGFTIQFSLPIANDKSLEKDWVYFVNMRYWCNWTQKIWPIYEQTPKIYFRPTK
jgi:hypothetical protein